MDLQSDLNRFDDFTNLTLDWFWEVDLDFNLIYSNHQLEVMTSMPIEELIGKTLGVGLGWDLSGEDWQEFREKLENNEVIDDFTYSFIHPEDGLTHFSIAAKPLINKKRQIIGYRGCARDITVEVNNSLNAELIEERLTDTIECIPYGIALFDKYDKLVFLNTKHRNLFPQMDDLMLTGTSFEDIVRGSIERGIQKVTGDVEAFVRKRMALHRNGYGTREVQLSNDRWVELTEHETIEGGTVLSWTDLTPVKRREGALASLLEDASNNWSVPERAAKAIAVALGCRWAGVVKIDNDNEMLGDVIALWDTDQLLPTKKYEIINGPCEQVYNEKSLVRIRESLDLQFPDREFLKGEKVYNYRGFALKNGKGQCIGHVFAADDEVDPKSHYEGNEIFRLISHWVEIEFRRQFVQRKMIDSQKRFRDFAEVASDWFWEIDENLNYTFISEHAGTKGQMRLRELLQKAHKKVGNQEIPPRYDLDKPAKEIIAYRSFRDVAVELKSHKEEQNRMLKVSGRPIFDNDGQFKGYRGTGSDITELVNAIQRASQAEQWLAEAIESSPEAFALYDASDRLIICNQRFKDTFFLGMQDVVKPGMTFDDLQHIHFENGLSDIPEDEVDDFLKHRKEYRGEQDGSPGRELLTNGRSYLSLEHKTQEGGIASFYVDITKLRENERSLRHAKEIAETASRGKSEFLANVSHELRTPLNAIIGFSELVRDDLAGPPDSKKYKEYINDIHASGMHLMELINDILDLSKAEAGLISQQGQETDMREIIDSSIKFILPRANKADICVTQHYPKGAFPKVWIDPKRGKQIMLNLISNAVKFTPDGGSVDVTAEITEDNALEIRVADTGIGIAKEDLPKAMEAFGQVDSALSRKYEGTGLGLPLTKRLVDSNNGELHIHSVPNEGTVVTVRFPQECLRTGSSS